MFIFFSIRKTAVFLPLSAAALVIFVATLGPLVIQRMEKIEISRRERSLLERVQYYTAAWHIFRAYPILGLGWGCEFSARDINIHGRYVPPPPRPYAMNRAVFGESTVHSAYLQMLVRIGLLGLIPFLLFLWQWVKLLLRERMIESRNERDHNLFVGVCGGMVGYLAHAGLENFFQWPVMSQSFWLLLGLTTVMAAHLIQHGAMEPAVASPLRPETREAGA